MGRGAGAVALAEHPTAGVGRSRLLDCGGSLADGPVSSPPRLVPSRCAELRGRVRLLPGGWDGLQPPPHASVHPRLLSAAGGQGVPRCSLCWAIAASPHSPTRRRHAAIHPSIHRCRWTRATPRCLRCWAWRAWRRGPPWWWPPRWSRCGLACRPAAAGRAAQPPCAAPCPAPSPAAPSHAMACCARCAGGHAAGPPAVPRDGHRGAGRHAQRQVEGRRPQVRRALLVLVQLRAMRAADAVCASCQPAWPRTGLASRTGAPPRSRAAHAHAHHTLQVPPAAAGGHRPAAVRRLPVLLLRRRRHAEPAALRGGVGGAGRARRGALGPRRAVVRVEPGAGGAPAGCAAALLCCAAPDGWRRLRIGMAGWSAR